MSERIAVVAAGGTGGHMFPAQALAEEMIRRGWRVVLATDDRGALYADNTARIIAGRPSLAPGAEWTQPARYSDERMPWPWHARHWKPTGDPVRDLTKAGTLLAAAIDSIEEERSR